MTFKGFCPKTKKTETIYCHTISCYTTMNTNDAIPGLMYACSVDPKGKNLCSECPINLNKNRKQSNTTK